MDPERWKRIDSLVHAAVEREPRDRAAFIEQACAGDASLQREVETLIAYQVLASSFLEKPAYQRAASLIADIPAEFKPGDTIAHYRIEAKIGAGGMGVVYKAEDINLGRPVAVKFLAGELAGDDEAHKRFVREARAASALDHPNICAVYEIGESDGMLFIASQYIEGKTLSDVVNGAALPLGQAIDFSIQLAGALGEAHRRNVIHRDIKPGNVMVDSRSHLRILDFGLAKFTGPGAGESNFPTLTGSPFGTPGYLSPEQARGEPADARSDIFSLGVVMYEMLTGRLPFRGESMIEVLYSVMHDEPPPVAESRPEAPAALERIVNKAMRKAPEDRYQSVDDLRADLESLKDEPGLGVEPRRSGRLLSRSDSRRHPATKPTLAYASLALLVLAGIAGYLLIGDRKAIDSIAVMPFANESGDPALEYLSDGITESLISELAQLPNLKVMSRNSAFHYKGREIDPQSVGRDLKVRAVLTGRVAQRGDSLAFSLELADARDGRQIWGEQYNRKLSDILGLQSEISRRVSEKLRLRLTGEQQRTLARSYTSNSEAYQLYLKGRYHWNKRTRPEDEKAIELFKKAIEIDPKYALAYCGLSDCWDRWGLGGDTPPREVGQKAKEAALTAIDIDPALAEAHASLAIVKTDYDWDFPAAEREFRRAVELNPDYVMAHQFYGMLLARLKRFDEAIAQEKRALDIDPLSIFANHNLGYVYHIARQYDQAIEQLRKTIELDPTFRQAQVLLVQSYLGKGLYEEAMAKLPRPPGEDARALAQVAYLQAVTGKPDDARKGLEWLKELSKRRYVTPYAVAVVYSGLRDKDQSLEWLEKAYNDRDPNMLTLGSDPRFDSLSSDTRFKDLLRRMGLPE